MARKSRATSSLLQQVPEHIWANPQMQQALADLDFGTVLRLARRAAGWTQVDTSAITGMSQALLSLLEAGKRQLTDVHQIRELLKSLHVPEQFHPIAPSRAQFLQTNTEEHVGWESPFDVARRAGQSLLSNTSETSLDLLETCVQDIVDQYETEGPSRMAAPAQELRAELQELLNGQQPPAHRTALFRLASRVSGLLGYMAVNAGRGTLADAYLTESVSLAQAVDDTCMIQWSLGTRSLRAFYAGDFRGAARWAADGIDLAPDSPQAIRLLSNGLARALARQGDRTGTVRALGTAMELGSRHEVPEGLTSCISQDPYGTLRTLANGVTAYVALGDTEEVLRGAATIDVGSAASPWSKVLVRLDVATVQLAGQRPDVEAAMMLGRQVLEGAQGPPILSVLTRAGELRQLAATWRHLPAVSDYEEALRTWTATPAVRAIGVSATMTAPQTTLASRSARHEPDPEASPRGLPTRTSP